MPTEPVSLYFDLEPGQTAELETVATASLEFVAGLREVAYLLDPSFEFRIELKRGDEGSLWLKAFLRWVRGFGFAHPTMSAVIVAAASWFAAETGSYTYEKALDHFLASKDPEITRLPPDQVEAIARRVADIARSESAAVPFKRLYRVIEKDPAIRGVGVANQHDRVPDVIVPRSDFAGRAGVVVRPVEVGAERERAESGDYVITRANLKAGTGRWRLRGENGEFSAVIADPDFNDAILAGTAPVPLAAEIHMNADVVVTEERTPEGAWKPKKYVVTAVHSITRAPTQPSLFAPPHPDRP